MVARRYGLTPEDAAAAAATVRLPARPPPLRQRRLAIAHRTIREVAQLEGLSETTALEILHKALHKLRVSRYAPVLRDTMDYLHEFDA